MRTLIKVIRIVARPLQRRAFFWARPPSQQSGTCALLGSLAKFWTCCSALELVRASAVPQHCRLGVHTTCTGPRRPLMTSWSQRDQSPAQAKHNFNTNRRIGKLPESPQGSQELRLQLIEMNCWNGYIPSTSHYSSVSHSVRSSRSTYSEIFLMTGSAMLS